LTPASASIFRRRQRRRITNTCEVCSKPAEKALLCAKHRKGANLRSARGRERARERGLCLDCRTAPSQPTNQRCVRCQAMKVVRNKNYRARNWYLANREGLEGGDSSRVEAGGILF
jgi:hypothetical protein